MPRWSHSTLLPALFALGCGGVTVDTAAQNADPCYPTPNVQIELGTWAQGFAPLGDTLHIERGQQGGRFVTLGLRGRNLDAWTYIAGEITVSLDDEEISSYAPWLNPTCEPFGQDAQIGPVAFDESAEALHEQDVKIIARVTDLSGFEAVTRRTVTLIDPQALSDSAADTGASL